MEGEAAWAWAFLGCAGAALVAYAAGLLGLRRRAGGLAVVLALAAGIQLAPLGAPLLLSTDAWAYWAYGRIAAVHGSNPYDTPPAAFPADPATVWVGSDWLDRGSVYGPAFTLASEPLALAADGSETAAAWLWKALAGGALVAAAILAARLRGGDPLAAAYVGWNPVLAVHAAGGGHNDAWVAVLVLGALALASRGRRGAAGVAWAGAVLVKWVPLLLLALRAVEARSSGRRVGHLGFAAAAAVVVAAASWRYGAAWLESFGPLAQNAARRTSYAIPSRLEDLGAPEWLALALPAGAYGLAFAWLLRAAARGRARLGLAAGLLLLAVPYLAPWYLAWAVPLAAAEEDAAARLLGIALSAYLLPQTVPI